MNQLFPNGKNKAVKFSAVSEIFRFSPYLIIFASILIINLEFVAPIHYWRFSSSVNWAWKTLFWAKNYTKEIKKIKKNIGNFINFTKKWRILREDPLITFTKNYSEVSERNILIQILIVSLTIEPKLTVKIKKTSYYIINVMIIRKNW